MVNTKTKISIPDSWFLRTNRCERGQNLPNLKKSNPDAMNYGGTTLHFGNRGLENLLNTYLSKNIKDYRV